MLRLGFALLLLPHYASSMLAGWVESPGYPHGYPPFASANWSRCAPSGQTLSLRLTHLDLEDSPGCEHDALKISADGNELERLCGKLSFEELDSSVNRFLLSSPGGCLSLSFHSDHSNSRRHTGFRGFYTLRDFDECRDDPDNGCTQFCHNYVGGYRCSCRPGYFLDPDQHTCTVNCSEDLSGSLRGVISSPSRPHPYAENAQCSYTLSVEEHLQLVLEFMEDFDVEQGPEGQCVDALRVQIASKLLGPLCGKVPPSPLVTESHNVNISFSSDGYGSNTGFTIHYSTKAKTCPGSVTSNSVMTPQFYEYKHGSKVTVTCDLGWTLDPVKTLKKALSDTSYESTCMRTGVWSPVFHCEPVNCGEPEIPEDDILQLTESDPSTMYGENVQFRCQSKYYTLEGDDKYTCNASGFWISETGQDKLPKCIEVCGKTESEISSGRILGGSVAKLGQIPWQLLILEPERAGASLINDRWAVTAAHAVYRFKEATINLFGGVIAAPKARERASEVIVLESEKIIIHPNFTEGVGETHKQRINYDNDIALIRLSKRVTLGPKLLPICLPETDEKLEVDQLGTISGWGATDTKDRSQMLRHTIVVAYTDSKCEDTPKNDEGQSLVFTKNMFCAGSQEGKDSCKGDSGGPFTFPRVGQGSKPHRLMGIVSWGSPCDLKEFKGYYTKVPNYVAWIKDTIGRVEKEEE